MNDNAPSWVESWLSTLVFWGPELVAGGALVLVGIVLWWPATMAGLAFVAYATVRELVCRWQNRRITRSWAPVRLALAELPESGSTGVCDNAEGGSRSDLVAAHLAYLAARVLGGAAGPVLVLADVLVIVASLLGSLLPALIGMTALTLLTGHIVWPYLVVAGPVAALGLIIWAATLPTLRATTRGVVSRYYADERARAGRVIERLYCQLPKSGTTGVCDSADHDGGDN